MTVINGAFSNRSFPVHSFLPPQLGKPKNPYLSQVSDSPMIKIGDINFADVMLFLRLARPNTGLYLMMSTVPFSTLMFVVVSP